MVHSPKKYQQNLTFLFESLLTHQNLSSVFQALFVEETMLSQVTFDYLFCLWGLISRPSILFQWSEMFAASMSVPHCYQGIATILKSEHLIAFKFVFLCQDYFGHLYFFHEFSMNLKIFLLKCKSINICRISTQKELIKNYTGMRFYNLKFTSFYYA